MIDDYLHLIGAVIRSGISLEGPGYPLTPGGRYWCELGTLDVEALVSQAAKFTWKVSPRAAESKDLTIIASSQIC